MSTPSTARGPRLSALDRWLPLWIGLAMVAGLVLGRFVPALSDVLAALEVGGISVPIALGLLVMMYPVLAKVRYDRVGAVTGDTRLLASSLVLNWLVGPALMFALAWSFLPDLPEYRTGLIVVGLARCIAMVVIWNDLACGDREAAAVLVAINSVFQVVAFSLLGYFYLTVLPAWLGLDTQGLDVSVGQIALNVLVFLGVPLVAGFASRLVGERARGRAWNEDRFLPVIGPWALSGLLFTIVLLFALQGEAVTSHPLDVARIALPLLVYFAAMWASASSPARRSRSATRAPRRSRSPRRATTSSSRSPSPSPRSVRPPARPWPESSVRSSRSPSWSVSSTSPCGSHAAGSPSTPTPTRPEHESWKR